MAGLRVDKLVKGNAVWHEHKIEDIDGLSGALIFKGEININSDFPLLSEVQNGWTYTILTDVTDNDPTKTNTGDSFLEFDEIAWNGTDWTVLGNSSAVTYTGNAERNVGGILDGDSFSAASMTEMWDKLIKEEKFPALTAPSSTFVSTITGLREIGDILSITFSSTFSRGSINPQYTATSPFRSGLPNEYQFTGTGLSNQTKTDLTDSQPITGYTVIAGAQSWQGRVAYDAGVQPKSSYDNDYSTPLAAGTTSYTTRTITGVYPYFATTATITVMTKQSLALMNSSYVQTDIIAESGSDKQKVDFPTDWSTITGIQFYNTVSSAWEWIGGSKANSLLTFTQSATTHTVQGNVITYTKYTHNGSTIGARQLRWYTT